jgi:hypothetical protein
LSEIDNIPEPEDDQYPYFMQTKDMFVSQKLWTELFARLDRLEKGQAQEVQRDIAESEDTSAWQGTFSVLEGLVKEQIGESKLIVDVIEQMRKLVQYVGLVLYPKFIFQTLFGETKEEFKRREGISRETEIVPDYVAGTTSVVAAGDNPLISVLKRFTPSEVRNYMFLDDFEYFEKFGITKNVATFWLSRMGL